MGQGMPHAWGMGMPHAPSVHAPLANNGESSDIHTSERVGEIIDDKADFRRRSVMR